MASLRKSIGLMRHRLVAFVSTKPRLYYSIRRVSGRMDDLCVTRNTDITIEGFPRSGNSTTVQSFLDSQTRPINVAHHKHHAAQLLQSVKWDIPAVVLIRNPRDACLSLLALALETKQRWGRTRDPGLGFEEVFSAYISFYEAVYPQLNKMVIAEFDCVKNNTGSLVDRVNDFYGTDFENKDVETSSVTLGFHATPNPLRNKIKKQIEKELDFQRVNSHRVRGLCERADHLYCQIVSKNECDS